MTGAPYFVQPTMGMYNRLISHLVNRKYTSKIVEVMREALPLHFAEVDAAKRARERLAAVIDKQRFSDKQRSDGSIESARQEWEYTRLIRTRNTFWMRRWTRQILTSLNLRRGFDGSKAKFVHALPQVLWEWRLHAPRQVRYETASGYVDLEFRTDEDMRKRAAAYATVAEEIEMLKEKSRRYVGNDWVVGYQMSERNLEERGLHRRRKEARREEEKTRRRLDVGPFEKKFGSSL
jgi:hypothetical protein